MIAQTTRPDPADAGLAQSERERRVARIVFSRLWEAGASLAATTAARREALDRLREGESTHRAIVAGCECGKRHDAEGGGDGKG